MPFFLSFPSFLLSSLPHSKRYLSAAMDTWYAFAIDDTAAGKAVASGFMEFTVQWGMGRYNTKCEQR